VHTETVEIYSDATNAVVMRHPGRRFPGVLIQGDTLASLVMRLDSIRRSASASAEPADELANVHEHLKELLQHYKNVLVSHSIELPFHD
jgi:predicted RNase H-like HicB family nuclease